MQNAKEREQRRKLAVRLHVAHETVVPRIPHRDFQLILSASDSFGDAQSIGLLPHDATVRAVQPDARQVTHLTQVYENIPLRRIPFEEERVGVDGGQKGNVCTDVNSVFFRHDSA